MKQFKLDIKELESDKDCKDFQVNSNGSYIFPAGTIIVNGCIKGIECGNIPFIPNKHETAKEQLAAWIDDRITGEK